MENATTKIISLVLGNDCHAICPYCGNGYGVNYSGAQAEQIKKYIESEGTYIFFCENCGEDVEIDETWIFDQEGQLRKQINNTIS